MTRATIALLFALLTPGIASASLVHDFAPLQELVSRADGIFVGKVTDVQSDRVPARNDLRSSISLEVQSELKGFADPDGRVHVSVPGGVLGDRQEVLKGAPTFSQGELVLVFLSRRTDGEYEVLEMAQGKFTIIPNASHTGLLATRDLSELYVLVPEGPARSYRTRQGPMEEGTLEGLLDQIATHVDSPDAEAIASSSRLR